VACREHLISDPVVPGPGTYEVKQIIGKETKKYSLRPKTTFDGINKKLLYMKQKKSLDLELTRHFLLFQNLGKIHNQIFQIQKHLCLIPRTQLDLKKLVILLAISQKRLPGPGGYEPKTKINNQGIYYISNFKNTLCKNFSQDGPRFHIEKTTNLGIFIYRCPWTRNIRFSF